MKISASSPFARRAAVERGKQQTPGSDGVVEPRRVTETLVMHRAVPENKSGIARKLHAQSSVIDKIAIKAGTGTLVFGHFRAQPGRPG